MFDLPFVGFIQAAVNVWLTAINDNTFKVIHDNDAALMILRILMPWKDAVLSSQVVKLDQWNSHKLPRKFCLTVSTTNR